MRGRGTLADAMHGRCRVGVWMAVAWLCAAIATASAQATGQEPTEEDRAAAREAFQAGVTAARDGRWDDARAAFEEAHARVPKAAILLNLAGAQRQTGRLVEAAESYRAFLERTEEGPAAQHRDAAERALNDVEARLPRVTIHADGMTGADRIHVGSRAIDREGLPGPIPLDPGEQVLVLRRGSEVVARRTLALEEGQRATVTLDVPPGVPSPDDAARAQMRDGAGPGPLADAPERRPLVRSPWLWTGIGVAVAAGVATALALGLRSADPEPHQGTFPPGTVTVP